MWPIVREIIKTAIENHQNLIVEGCYIPYEWRKDFSKEYLDDIRFICLSFTDNYIDSHFDDIKSHGSDLEKRIDDSDCTTEWLVEENEKYINGFQNVGETVVMIENNYEQTTDNLI